MKHQSPLTTASGASLPDPVALLQMQVPLVHAPSVVPPQSATIEATKAPTSECPTIPFATWVDKILAASTQYVAIETFAGVLASFLNSQTVRIAQGNESCRRVYDHRIGWISSDSELWADATAQWNELEFNAEWSSAVTAEWRIGYAIDSSHRVSVCVVDPKVTLPFNPDTARTLGVLVRLVQSRPKRNFAKVRYILGAHPKVTISLITFVLVVGMCFPVRYPIACTARIQPVGQRFVAAPFAATLASVHVHRGDTVVTDQLLYTLDGRPLRLERDSLHAELELAKKEREVALAARRIADAQQADLKQLQLQRRAELLDDRLSRLQVRSPIDGIVVAGDFEKYIGSPIETGQTLVEIAPLDQVSVEVEIPEHEIGFVTEQASTRIRFASVDSQSHYHDLGRLSPIAEVREEKNLFVARIQLENSAGLLRPGLLGEANVYGPYRPLCWRVARTIWERLLWWGGY
jgi:biotin carboxyl carrier protein